MSKEITLGEVLEIKRGASLSGKYYSKDGKYKRLTLGNFRYPENGFKENISKDDIYFVGPIKNEFILKKGDIITPLTEQVRGLLGNTATIPDDNLYIQSGDIGLVIPDESLLDKRFAYYLVSSDLVKAQLDASSQQTKIRHTSPEKIKDCKAILPDSIDEQRKIAAILDAINLAISNNEKANDIINSILNSFYERWFHQFNFINDKGLPYRDSQGSFEHNDTLGRDIPCGWKVESLAKSSLCSDIKPGVSRFDKKVYLPTANIIDEHITDGNIITFDNRESRANMEPRQYSVWFAKMKNSVKHLSIPGNSDWFTSKYILSTGFQGLQCTPDSYPYIHCIINSCWFEQYKNRLAHGATQESVNMNDLDSVTFPVPPQSVLKLFSKICGPLLEEKFALMLKTQELSKLQKFLMPLLMNDKIVINN